MGGMCSRPVRVEPVTVVKSSLLTMYGNGTPKDNPYDNPDYKVTFISKTNGKKGHGVFGTEYAPGKVIRVFIDVETGDCLGEVSVSRTVGYDSQGRLRTGTVPCEANTMASRITMAVMSLLLLCLITTGIMYQWTFLFLACPFIGCVAFLSGYCVVEPALARFLDAHVYRESIITPARVN